MEVQEDRTGRIEIESPNKSYGHKAEMMDKKSCTVRSKNDLPRRSDFSVISNNIVQNASSRDSRSTKILDEPNDSELHINTRKNKVTRTRNDLQDHEVIISHSSFSLS